MTAATSDVATRRPWAMSRPPEVPEPDLELLGLTKRYGDLLALDDCSLTVQPGRVLGLLGPNGAGKTTAMRCIVGLVQPDHGEIRWAGAPIDRAARLRFGYMPEERGLYPKMQVRTQLEYLARLSGLDSRSAAASVARWLARLELEARGDTRVDALSHGNQQRVQLAAALVHDPVALVLDEPFAGLDPIGVEALSAVISELAAEGTAVLFSSHQLDLVEHVCQDVVIVDHGRVVMHGELDALRRRPACAISMSHSADRTAGRRLPRTPSCACPSQAAPGSSCPPTLTSSGSPRLPSPQVT
jgi:ABC-2 type transport system ATP-binding protein